MSTTTGASFPGAAAGAGQVMQQQPAHTSVTVVDPMGQQPVAGGQNVIVVQGQGVPQNLPRATAIPSTHTVVLGAGHGQTTQATGVVRGMDGMQDSELTALGLDRFRLKMFAMGTALLSVLFFSLTSLSRYMLVPAFLICILSVVLCTGMCAVRPVGVHGQEEQQRLMPPLCCGCNNKEHTHMAVSAGIASTVFFIVMFFWSGGVAWFFFFLVVSIIGCCGMCSTPSAQVQYRGHHAF